MLIPWRALYYRAVVTRGKVSVYLTIWIGLRYVLIPFERMLLNGTLTPQSLEELMGMTGNGHDRLVLYFNIIRYG